MTSSFSGRLVVALLALLVIASPVTAQSQPAWAADAFDRSGPMVAEYNRQVDGDALGIAGDQLKGERVNLHVQGEGGEAVFSFRMDDALRITELQDAPRDDATLKMTVSRAAYDRILAADDPAAAFQTAVTEGEITFDGLGFTSAVKWVIVNVAVDFLRGIGLV